MKSVFRPALSGMSIMVLSALAQAEQVEFDDITVTTTRAERSVLETPASVSRKSGAEVEADRAVTQRELLNSISGVRISQTGSGHGHFTSIRLPTSTDPYYLFLQDGVPVQSSGFFNHNALVYTNFGAAGSVEVLKGAGTALYGSDAVGGTINVLSTNPMDNLGIKGSLEGGSDDFRRITLTAGAEIDSQSAISAHISHAEGDGFRDHSEFDRQEFSLNYINDLNDDNTLKVILNVNKTDAEMTSSIRGFREFRDNPESAGRNVLNNAFPNGIDPIRQFDYARLSAEWQHQLNDMTDLSTIIYFRNNRNRFYRTWEGDIPKSEQEEKTLGLLFKANMDFGRYRVISGFDTEYTRGETLTDQELAGGSVPVGEIFDYDVDYIAFAPYARFEFDLTDKLTLGLGGRYDYNHFDYTNNLSDGEILGTVRGVPGVVYFRADSSEDRTFNHFSPKVDLTYRINDNQSVYARYANGFRVPQVGTLYSLTRNNRPGSFDEEVTDTFEIGYKARYKQHQLETALYHLVIDDTIDSVNQGSIRVNENFGKTLHTGIEISLASQWTDEWATKIAYSHSEHEYDDNDTFGDNDLPEAPENLANVRLIYTPNAVPGLYAMLEWEHVGSWWLDRANTERYAGHDLANLKVNYDVNSHLTVFGRINNITDRLYADRAVLEFGEDYTPGASRQAFVGFEYKL